MIKAWAELRQVQAQLGKVDSQMWPISTSFEYIYHWDIDCSGLTLLELYDIVNLAEMYDMPKLMAQIKMQMEIALSMDNFVHISRDTNYTPSAPPLRDTVIKCLTPPPA